MFSWKVSLKSISSSLIILDVPAAAVFLSTGIILLSEQSPESLIV
jgi:hypothetical protein